MYAKNVSLCLAKETMDGVNGGSWGAEKNLSAFYYSLFRCVSLTLHCKNTFSILIVQKYFDKLTYFIDEKFIKTPFQEKNQFLRQKNK